jgi:hypothetical protein
MINLILSIALVYSAIGLVFAAYCRNLDGDDNGLVDLVGSVIVGVLWPLMIVLWLVDAVAKALGGGDD